MNVNPQLNFDIHLLHSYFIIINFRFHFFKIWICPFMNFFMLLNFEKFEIYHFVKSHFMSIY
jgi:hypothetical protein